VHDLTFTAAPGIVTGFVRPERSWQVEDDPQDRGLDAPGAETVFVERRRYQDSHAPLADLGTVLEASAVHTGRSAFHRL
jgi:ABC-2 type transport system ATP-binding protein